MPTIAGLELPKAAPCKCGCPTFWLDPSNRPFCRACTPPPHPSLDRGSLTVVTIDGRDEWEEGDSRQPAVAKPDRSAEQTVEWIGDTGPPSTVRYCPFCRSYVSKLETPDGSTVRHYQCQSSKCGRKFCVY